MYMYVTVMYVKCSPKMGKTADTTMAAALYLPCPAMCMICMDGCEKKSERRNERGRGNKNKKGEERKKSETRKSDWTGNGGEIRTDFFFPMDDLMPY
jgi:hypothetical protein